MKRYLLLFCALAVAGCALLGKNEPLVPRYFTPEYEGDAPAAKRRSDLQLRLGRIEGWSHLRERMVRNANRELFYYEDRRWTERPEVYLRRAFSRAIFEERGVVESLSSRAVTLDLELIAFEEIEPSPAGAAAPQPHQARMQVLLTLRDDRTGLFEETITVERPVAKVAGSDPARAVADALSQALHEGVTRIADRVLAKLDGQPPRAGN